MSERIKVKNSLPKVSVKDKAVVNTKRAVVIGKKGSIIGSKILADKIVSTAGSVSKFDENGNVMSSVRSTSASLHPSIDQGKAIVKRGSQAMQRQMFNDTMQKPIKTRTAFSPLSARRKMYADNYRRNIKIERSAKLKRVGKVVTKPIAPVLSKVGSNRAVKGAGTAIKKTAKAVKIMVQVTIKLMSSVFLMASMAVLLIIILIGGMIFSFGYSEDITNPFGDENYVITSAFGEREDPISGVIDMHEGWDVASLAGEGTPIYSVCSGKVVAAVTDNISKTGYGSYVTIAPDDQPDITVKYAHLSMVMVSAGDIVNAGQVIGLEGDTGKSTGPHLHFEVRLLNEPVDGAKFYNILADADNAADYGISSQEE